MSQPSLVRDSDGEKMLTRPRYFNSEKHSDLTIRFGEKEMKAHKIAVCSQSKYFAKCCEGQFQVCLVLSHNLLIMEKVVFEIY